MVTDLSFLTLYHLHSSKLNDLARLQSHFAQSEGGLVPIQLVYEAYEAFCRSVKVRPIFAPTVFGKGFKQVSFFPVASAN